MYVDKWLNGKVEWARAETRLRGEKKYLRKYYKVSGPGTDLNNTQYTIRATAVIYEKFYRRYGSRFLS